MTKAKTITSPVSRPGDKPRKFERGPNSRSKTSFRNSRVWNVDDNDARCGFVRSYAADYRAWRAINWRWR